MVVAEHALRPRALVLGRRQGLRGCAGAQVHERARRIAAEKCFQRRRRLVQIECERIIDLDRISPVAAAGERGRQLLARTDERDRRRARARALEIGDVEARQGLGVGETPLDEKHVVERNENVGGVEPHPAGGPDRPRQGLARKALGFGQAATVAERIREADGEPLRHLAGERAREPLDRGFALTQHRQGLAQLGLGVREVAAQTAKRAPPTPGSRRA